MFTSIQSKTSSKVTVEVDGVEHEVPEGITVAAALLGHTDECDCRTSVVSGEKRAPYCYMGVCHECLMEIDGKPNQQSCLIQVENGMRINKQQIREGE